MSHKICLKKRTKTKKYLMTVVVVYCPPKQKRKQETNRKFLVYIRHSFVIGADYNAKHSEWGLILSISKVGEVLKVCEQLNCDALCTGKPSYWPTDMTDIFLFKNCTSNYLEMGWIMNLDHSLILLIITEKVVPLLVKETTDWESFKEELE